MGILANSADSDKMLHSSSGSTLFAKIETIFRNTSKFGYSDL